MSAVEELEQLYRTERALADVERQRMTPRDEPPMRKSWLKSFDELSPQDQLTAIRDQFRKHPSDRGLVGEAVNEHPLSEALFAAAVAGDIEQAGRLYVRCVCEYIGPIVQRAWDREEGQ